MENLGLVSIITPSYNSAPFIAETIESIINQSYPYWELLITDDCSSDNTIEIIQEFIKKDSRIKLFQLNQNSGAGICRNKSIENAASEPKVAVVRCNGTCANRPKLTQYDGVRSCVVANSTFGGETGCTFGCLGCGDCVSACLFDAIHMNPETGLPEVDESKCTACGACSKACPRNIIEIRPKGKNNRRVYVQCVNKDKGAVARKACAAACIGCGKCVKVCPFEAITLENNLAYIDPAKCKSCRKCEMECPQQAIVAVNFPPRKPKAEAPAAEKPAVEKTVAASPKTEAVKNETVTPATAPAAEAPKNTEA